MRRTCPRCRGTRQVEVGEVCFEPIHMPCGLCVDGTIEESDECQARVPDHTDYVGCGREAVRGGYCLEHANEEAQLSREKIKRLEKEIATERARLFLLTSESGRVEARAS